MPVKLQRTACQILEQVDMLFMDHMSLLQCGRNGESVELLLALIQEYRNNLRSCNKTVNMLIVDFIIRKISLYICLRVIGI